jgi:hypothetical protein
MNAMDAARAAESVSQDGGVFAGTRRVLRR